MKAIFLINAFVFMGMLANNIFATSNIYHSKQIESVKRQATNDVKNKIEPLLQEYCENACQIIDVNVNVIEEYANTEDIGFESLSEENLAPNYEVSDIKVSIQIDKRVSLRNKDRLDHILKNHLNHYSTKVSLDWIALEIPQIGASETTLESLKEQVSARLNRNLNKVVNMYCPDACLISNILVKGRLINPDEASLLNDRQYAHDISKQSYMAIDEIIVEAAIDQGLSEKAKNQIIAMMKAKTKMYENINFEIDYPEFPETFSQKKERAAKDSDDPYGLEKLRHMLTIFRDLAGTKEIISKSTETSDRQSQMRSTASDSLSSQEQSGNWPIYLLVFLFSAGFITFIILRYANAKRDADLLSFSHIPQLNAENQNNDNKKSQNLESSEPDYTSLKKNLSIEQLKKELTTLFIESPKVAKETFSRLLQEEGVEETAKFVHIFGKMVIFELLNDPALHRRLYELSEYYHKSNFSFSLEEEEYLLKSLKKRVTANEIRILTRMTTDQFDFLTRLDTSQIFNLIKDENPQIQSVVITQLTPSRRRNLFDMFVGDTKINLLKQLCMADAIPKEYLLNVAKALGKKVLSKPEFDTQSLKSSDILLDLLEKASLPEQKELMANLLESNPDAARSIKMKLVTIEMLPYLKNGHLLELVLGLNQDDLTTFLAGCPEHIQKLLLSHAPSELAQSWIEELSSRSGIDDNKYRLVEITILEKVRHLASNGAINILDINDMIFGTIEDIIQRNSQISQQTDHNLVSSGQIVA